MCIERDIIMIITSINILSLPLLLLFILIAAIEVRYSTPTLTSPDFVKQTMFKL